jgi:hypothetical protein
MEKKKCGFCSKEFDDTDIGMLGCNYHPGKYEKFGSENKRLKYGPNHFVCCGSSLDINDITHYESIKPIGCFPIDHRTKKESENIINTPYIIMELEIARDLPIYQKYISNTKITKNVFVFIERIQENISIKLPLNKKLNLNLDEIQDILKKKAEDRFEKITIEFKQRHDISIKKQKNSKQDMKILERLIHNNDKESEEDYKLIFDILKLQDKIQNKGFIPFCIIVRVSNEPDPIKEEEINGIRECPIQTNYKINNSK